MSRRHASTVPTTLHRTVVAALAMLLAATALMPSVAVAQADGSFTPRMIQHEWQLLTQRSEQGDMENVPAGVGATMQLRSNAAFGEGACSAYDSSYEQAANTLSVFVQPDEIEWRDCDDVSRGFDEQFYENLGRISSIAIADDILAVNDVIGERLMVFTRARIDPDPTASRWSLARIGDADGAVNPVIQGLDPWMEFLVGGSVVGNTGCGSFLGKYATNEGRIDITDVHYRLVACADGARTQAERILATLGAITDFEVRPAGLALKDENGVIRLALEPELDVASRTWTPVTIYGPDGGLQYDGNELTTSAIQFIGGRYEGRSICRPFFGNALRSGLAISIGGLTFIGDYCKGSVKSGQLGDIEEGFTTALLDAASYALRGDELTLTDVDGILRAVLEPQPPLTGTTWYVFRMFNGKKLVEPATDGVPITATFEDIGAATIGAAQGNTGVSNGAGENEWYATYDTPAATRINVIDPYVVGKGCNSKANRNKAPCKNEQRFLKLLQQANGYVTRTGDLKFYKDRRNILVLRPLLSQTTEE